MKGLPTEHLIASIATEPFCGTTAFSLGGRHRLWESDKFSASLWHACELQFTTQWPNVSIDELVQIRDAFWCANRRHSASYLADLWTEICCKFLQVNGPVAYPNARAIFDQTSGLVGQHADQTARRIWRWLCFSVAEDTLLVGTWTNEIQPSTVEIIPRHLADRLHRHRFGEPHLHLGAALQFPDLWNSVMRVVGHNGSAITDFEAYGGAFNNGKALADWLLRAGIARVIMASFLTSESPVSFSTYLKEVIYDKIATRLGNAAVVILNKAIQELIAGKLQGPTHQTRMKFSELQQVYRILAGQLPFRQPRTESLEDFRRLDCIGKYFPHRSNTTSEMHFQFAGLNRLRTADSADGNGHESWGSCQLFAPLFWQYLRVRNIYYRHIVLRPFTPGLPWFIRTYNRISVSTKAMSPRSKLESAAQVSGNGNGLYSLEVRTSPKDSKEATYTHLKQLAESARGLLNDARKTQQPHALEEIGVVIHFSRTRGKSFESGWIEPLGRNLTGDPSSVFNSSHYRYGEYYKQLQSQANILCQFLWDWPAMLKLIRGVDACNDESSVPLWVLCPAMRRLKRVSQEVAAQQSRLGETTAKAIRTTIHVGEDWVHVLSGLRKIAEALEHLEYQCGDRLGHAIALGIDIARWASANEHVIMAKEDRLWDLVWELKQYKSGRCKADTSRLTQIQYTIEEMAHDCFQVRDISQIEWLYRSLYDEAHLRGSGFHDGGGPRQTPKHAESDLTFAPLLRRYLKSEECYREGRKGVWVNVADELNVLESLQRQLVSNVCHRGVLVEINPSSNLIIGNLHDLKHHPLIRLAAGVIDENQVQVVVGSDDPIMFSSPLPQEFALLSDALVAAKVPPLQADLCVDRLRENSLAGRFTISWNSDDGPLASPNRSGRAQKKQNRQSR